MRVDQQGRDVHALEGVVVVQAADDLVTPGNGIGESLGRLGRRRHAGSVAAGGVHRGEAAPDEGAGAVVTQQTLRGQVAHVHEAGLGEECGLVRAEEAARDLGGGHLAGDHLVLAVARKVGVEAEGAELVVSTETRAQRREGGEEELHVVDLQRLVVTVAHLALEGDALVARVEAGAEEVHVARELDDVAAGGGAREQLELRILAADAGDGGQQALQGGERVERRRGGGISEGGADEDRQGGGHRHAGGAGGRAETGHEGGVALKCGGGVARDVGHHDAFRRRPRRDDRQAAVVIHVVEAEFRATEALGQVAEVDTILAGIARFVVRAAADGAERRAVTDRAEAEVNLAAALRDKVVRAEVGARRVDARALPIEQVERLHAEALGDADRGGRHHQGAQRLLQFGARRAELGDIDRVHRVDAVGDEGALAPAQDLLADAERGRHAGDILVEVDVGVEELAAGSDDGQGLVAQLGAGAAVVGVDEIVEVEPAHEQAGLLVFDQQVVVGLHQERRDARPVVQVAVVRVDGALEAAVGEAVEGPVGVVQAIERADRNRGVEAAFGVTDFEQERAGGGREPEDGGQGGRGRQAQITGNGVTWFHRRVLLTPRKRGSWGWGRLKNKPCGLVFVSRA